MRKVNYKEKGITLIALVITIIILLILAGVTLNTALSENGLFKMAKKAVNEYQKSEKQEQEAMKDIAEEMDKISIDYNDYVGAYVTGYNPKTVTAEYPCTIGTDTSGYDQPQTFTTEEGMKWRIWDYDKTTKTIRLISSKPTEATLQLSGVQGYNNGVWTVNEICRECYGSEKNGITVANLRRTDIQKVSTYDYTQYKHDANNWQESEKGTVYFGSSNGTYSNPEYPKMWGDYDSHWTYGYDGSQETGSDKECEMWEREYGDGMITGKGSGISSPTFRQSFYCHDYLDQEAQFNNKKYFDLLFRSEDGDIFSDYCYWIACRFVNLDSELCDFGLQFVNAVFVNNWIDGFCLFNSYRYPREWKF